MIKPNGSGSVVSRGPEKVLNYRHFPALDQLDQQPPLSAHVRAKGVMVFRRPTRSSWSRLSPPMSRVRGEGL